VKTLFVSGQMFRTTVLNINSEIAQKVSCLDGLQETNTFKNNVVVASAVSWFLDIVLGVAFVADDAVVVDVVVVVDVLLLSSTLLLSTTLLL